MIITAIEIHQLDETHCLVHVRWNSVYENGGKHVEIPFTNAYLLEQSDRKLKVFGWITGDEARVLKDNGLM